MRIITNKIQDGLHQLLSISLKDSLLLQVHSLSVCFFINVVKQSTYLNLILNEDIKRKIIHPFSRQYL